MSDLEGRRISAVAAVTASLALGDEARLKRAFGRAESSGVSGEWLAEAMLQSLLFAGYPRTIQALEVWRRTTGRRSRVLPVESVSLAARRRRGRALCARIYGEAAFPRLMSYLEGLHADLAAWVIEEGYGRVLSRAELDAGRRECALLPILAVQEAWPQFLPHVRGAVRCGCLPSQLRRLWRDLRGWMPETSRRRAARATDRALAGFEG